MRVQSSIDIDAPAAKIWELVGNPCSYPLFVAGVVRFSPESDPSTGLGARFTTRMQVGSVPVGALVEIVEQVDERDLAWTSITGLEHRGRWRLRRNDDGTTHVTFRLAYKAPGGVMGLLADRAAAPMVQRNLDETVVALKERIEGRAAHHRRRADPFELLGTALDAAKVLGSVGILRPARPDRLLDAMSAVRTWGANPAAAVIASAARFPDEAAIIDDDGSLTYRELDDTTNGLANAWAASGIGPGTTIGLLCRNHRWFVVVQLAAAKLGADLVLLNTGFSGPQVADVCAAEGVDVLVHDEELADLVPDEVDTLVADDGSLADVVRAADPTPPAPPEQPGRVVILTSGTTGRPKGAARSAPSSLEPAIALLSRIPLRVRDTTVIAPPLFHAWGLTHLVVGLSLSATIVLSRRFEPAEVLEAIEEHRARVLVAVPVMLERLLEVDDDVRAAADTSSLEVVAVSGSALSASLARRFMDEFGDVLYNLYGSTEVAWATIADPAQLRAAPGTAGTVPRGTVVKIFGDDGIELPRGRRGRIFVGNSMTFSGYTGGGGKEVLHGLVDSGDMGHFDVAGRLFVDGRSDDMIVSGGENVFPQEVEELLVEHPDIAEAVVVGVDDEKFGQRLAAFVVPRNGRSVSADAVRRHVKDRLARHKVPRDVEVVDELPRNATGKVLRRELAERVAS